MSTNVHLVSVIIVLYNSVDYIAKCLDSLRIQTYEPIEIIAYDNASTDGTQALVRENYPEVKLIEGDENIGFAAANNQAAAAAQGEFLAFLNPDTVVAIDWIMPLVDTLQIDQGVGAVTPTILFADTPDIVNTCGNEVHLSGVTYCRDYGQPVSNGRTVEVAAISGAAFIMPRVLFEQVDGFEDRFFMYFEDTDLSLRLRCSGFRCLAVPYSKVYHAYKATFGTNKIFYLERNRLLTMLSLLDWRLLGLMLPSLFLIEFVVWGYCIIQGRQAFVAKVRSWQDIVKNWPWISERRRCYASQCNIIAMLNIFRPWLKIQYVSPGNTYLSRIVELLGWITAAPMLKIAKILG